MEQRDVPVYLRIADKAKHLRELGMSDKAIARALGVSDKTVAKAMSRAYFLGVLRRGAVLHRHHTNTRGRVHRTIGPSPGSAVTLFSAIETALPTGA